MFQDSIHLSLHSHCLAQPWPLSKLLLFSVGAEVATHEPHKMRVSYLHHNILQKTSVLTPSLHHLNNQHYCTTQEHEMLMYSSGFGLSIQFSFIPVPHLYLTDSVHPRHDSATECCKNNVGYFFFFLPWSLFLFWLQLKINNLKSNLTSQSQILYSKNCWFKCRNLGNQELMHCHVSNSESWKWGLSGDRTAFPLGPTSICWSMETAWHRTTQTQEWDRGVGKKVKGH